MKLLRYLPEINDDLKPLLSAAFTMAEMAGDIHLKYFSQSNLSQSTKLNESDVVTIADKESETAVINYIKSHFPSHGIISEESGSDHSDRDWRWVIDPLDGTTNYVMGLPVFSVSIALEYKEEAILGVVFAPYLEECFYAVKGKGAWLNGKKIRCSEKEKISHAVLATGMPYDRNDNPDNNMPEITRMAFKVRGIRRMGSAAIDLCYTGAGFFDAYWELNLNLWDIAAGKLIASESGVEIVTIRSNRNHSILASNPHLLNQIRQILLEQKEI